MLTSTSPPWWSREERRRLQQRLELEEEGRVSAVVNHPRQRGRKEREVCGVGEMCGSVLSHTVWGCLFTHWLGKNYNFRIRYKVECAYLHTMSSRDEALEEPHTFSPSQLLIRESK